MTISKHNITAATVVGAVALTSGFLLFTGCGQQAPPPAAPAMDQPAETAPAETAPAPAEAAPAPAEVAPAAAPAAAPTPTPAPPKPASSAAGGSNAPTSGAEGASANTPATPTVRMLTLPAGKRMKIDLDGSLSTATSKVGDRFVGTVNKTVRLDSGSIVAVPKGAKIEGSVSNVESAKRTKGLAKLELRFETLVLADGTRVPLVASMKSEGESTKKKDTATIAGAAVGGAILGALIGKDGKGAAIGAIAGGAIGTGVVLGTKGNEVEIPPGTELVIEMDQAISLPAPPAAVS